MMAESYFRAVTTASRRIGVSRSSEVVQASPMAPELL
jgi:hypothetical protein